MARMTIRDLGYTHGQLPAGPKNSILDVKGVRVGQVTVGSDNSDVLKGVTVILPPHPDEISIPCYAGMHTLNGKGEVSGSYQIKDLGFTNTNIDLNDLSHNYGTPIVGETADWHLNDVYQSALEAKDVHGAFAQAMIQEEVLEGQNGGGAGMTCHIFPAGTGTSSRIVNGTLGTEEEYTVGVLVQTNYGQTHDLQIGGVPIGKLLLKDKKMEEEKTEKSLSGKVDEAVSSLSSLPTHPSSPTSSTAWPSTAPWVLAQVGGHGNWRNFSGDIILALSTANKPDEKSADTAN